MKQASSGIPLTVGLTIVSHVIVVVVEDVVGVVVVVIEPIMSDAMIGSYMVASCGFPPEAQR